MESITAKQLHSPFAPVAFYRTNTKPEGAIQPKAGGFGCVMAYFAQAAAKGKTSVFDAETVLCPGAHAGFGFGNNYRDFIPGYPEFYPAFFSFGVESAADPEKYRGFVNYMPKDRQEFFLKGERIYKTPEDSEKVHVDKTYYTSPEKYACLTPLSELPEGTLPLTVTFTVKPVDMDVLVHFLCMLHVSCKIAPGNTSACQALASAVLEEKNTAVIGLTDLAGRMPIRGLIPDEYMTFTVPGEVYQKMEKEAGHSVFQGVMWQAYK